MTQYDQFAPFYDHVVGSRDSIGKLLQRLVKRYNPRAKTLLELGCGSGSMLVILSKRYKSIGIDNSKGMLAIARKKAPKAKLLHGDITQFDLSERFDAIVCPFDTINHVTSFAKWKNVFERAHRHLNPGGVFIFDVNTEHKMEEYRSDPITADVENDVVSMVQVKRRRRYHYDVILKIFRRRTGSEFTLNEMILPELVVPTPTILRELAKYFRTVTLVDPDRRRPSSCTEELFFVCRDPR
jgi:ubiquinone/menaquinone biosynthesis C-methylase UbiE